MENRDKDGDIENTRIATNLKHFTKKVSYNFFLFFDKFKLSLLR